MVQVARNLLEEKIVRKPSDLGQKTQAVMTNRVLKPRKLCVLDMVEPTPANPGGIQIVELEATMNIPYLLISYSAEQFPFEERYNEQLLQMAVTATRDHDLAAFWIGCSCLDTATERRLANGSPVLDDVSSGSVRL